MASEGNSQFLQSIDDEPVRASPIDGQASRSMSAPLRPLTKNRTLTNLINKSLAAQNKAAPRFLIDPRTSRFITRWDGITALALIFTAICTPYEVAFVPASKYPWDGWFVVNRIIDAIFITDFAIQVCAPARLPFAPANNKRPSRLRLGCSVLFNLSRARNHPKGSTMGD